MNDIVFFPAEKPPDPEFPHALCGGIPMACHTLRFHRMTWYDDADQDAASKQILSLGVRPAILAGYSKSGLGVLRVALRLPGHVRALLVFDAPLGMPQARSGQAGRASEPDDKAKALAGALQASLHPSTPVILISGPLFHREMCGFSDLLHETGRPHKFIDGRHHAHRWDSGWVREGLKMVPLDRRT